MTLSAPLPVVIVLTVLLAFADPAGGAPALAVTVRAVAAVPAPRLNVAPVCAPALTVTGSVDEVVSVEIVSGLRR